MDNETKSEFVRVHEEFAGIHQQFARVDEQFAHVNEQLARINDHLAKSDERFERAMRGIGQQFEVQQKYMDSRFNDILEALDVRHGNHERRIRRLEDHVFGTE